MKKDLIKECNYYVEGMHCPSCELLIEKKLLKNKNIESVEASAGSGKLVIFYKNKKPSVDQLNRKFRKEGYSFSQKPIAREPKNSSIQVIAIALLFIVGFMLFSRSDIASRIMVGSSSALPAFFVFGLIAGISSCAALVGGIVLSMSKQWAGRLQPHLLFNLGRLISFALFGALLGAFGSLLQISLAASTLLAIGVSIVMVLLALQMLGIKHFQKFQVSPPKFISRFIADEANFQGRYMPFILGALTFFLPCGFTITTQGLALNSGSNLRSSLMMLFFALGTLPMLIAIGFSTFKLTARPHLSDKFLKIAGILVLFFGLYNFNSQLNVLGLPSLDDIKLYSSDKVQFSGEGLAPLINGKQVLKMDAFAYRYEPNEFKVRVGIPVIWEIKNKGVSGCSNAIVSRGLFNGQIPLNNDVNVKEFIPTKAGRYKFSCWMGMISGTISVVGQDGYIGESDNFENEEEIPSGARGCGSGGGCSGGCRGRCGNPACSYVEP